jgi:hypothetical protein
MKLTSNYIEDKDWILLYALKNFWSTFWALIMLLQYATKSGLTKLRLGQKWLISISPSALGTHGNRKQSNGLNGLP